MFSNPIADQLKSSADNEQLSNKDILDDTTEQSVDVSKAEETENLQKKTFSNPFASTTKAQPSNSKSIVKEEEVIHEKRKSVKDLIGNFGGNKQNSNKNGLENNKDSSNVIKDKPRTSVTDMVKGIEKKVQEIEEKRSKETELWEKIQERKSEVRPLSEKYQTPDFKNEDGNILDQDNENSEEQNKHENILGEVENNENDLGGFDRGSIRPTADFGVKPYNPKDDVQEQIVEEEVEKSEDYSKVLDASIDPDAMNVSMMKPVMNNPLDPNKSILDASMNQSDLNISRVREPFNPMKIDRKPWEMNFGGDILGGNNNNELQLNLINLESHLLSQRTEDTKDLSHMSIPKFKNQFYQRDNSFYLNMSQLNNSHITNKSQLNQSHLTNKSQNKSFNAGVSKPEKQENILDAIKNDVILEPHEFEPRITAQFGALEDVVENFATQNAEQFEKNLQEERNKIIEDNPQPQAIQPPNFGLLSEDYNQGKNNLSQLDLSKISHIQENFLENDENVTNISTQNMKLLLSPKPLMTVYEENQESKIDHNEQSPEKESNLHSLPENREVEDKINKSFVEPVEDEVHIAETVPIQQEHETEAEPETHISETVTKPEAHEDIDNNKEINTSHHPIQDSCNDKFQNQEPENEVPLSKSGFLQNNLIEDSIPENRNLESDQHKKFENPELPEKNYAEDGTESNIIENSEVHQNNLVEVEKKEDITPEVNNVDNYVQEEVRYTFSNPIQNEVQIGIEEEPEKTKKSSSAIREAPSNLNLKKGTSDDTQMKYNTEYNNIVEKPKYSSSDNSPLLKNQNNTKINELLMRYSNQDSAKIVDRIFAESKQPTEYTPTESKTTEVKNYDYGISNVKVNENQVENSYKPYNLPDKNVANYGSDNLEFKNYYKPTSSYQQYTNPFASQDSNYINNQVSNQEPTSSVPITSSGISNLSQNYPDLSSDLYKKYLNTDKDEPENDKKMEIKMGLKFKKKNRVRPQIMSPKTTYQLPVDRSFDLSMTICDEAKSMILIPVSDYNSNTEIFKRQVFGFQVKKEKFIRGVDQLKIDREEVDIICINCQELINISDVDKHSEHCYLQQNKQINIDASVHFTLKELNQKIELLAHKIELKLNLLSNPEKVEVQDCISWSRELRKEDSDESIIENLIEKFANSIRIIESFPVDAAQISLLILVNRLKLLAKEKLSEIQLAQFEDIDLIQLQQQLSNYERETLKQKAELELWKYQAEMLHEIKINDQKNLKYVKTQYRKDIEILSQIQSDIDYSDAESSCAGTSVTSAAPLQFENNLIFKSSAENAENEKLKIKFYSTAVNAKLNLPPYHPGKDMLISDLYEKSKSMNVPADSWDLFLKNEFDACK